MKARGALIHTHALLNPSVDGQVTWEGYSFELEKVWVDGSSPKDGPLIYRLSLLFIAVIKTLAKSNLGEKDLFSLIFQGNSPSLRY